MNYIKKSKHFEIRCRQRAISDDVLDALYIYGEAVDAKGGCSKIFFSKKSLLDIKEISRDLYKKVERNRRTYLVLSDDGTAVTAAIAH